MFQYKKSKCSVRGLIKWNITLCYLANMKLFRKKFAIAKQKFELCR